MQKMGGLCVSPGPSCHAPSPSQSPSYFRGEGILHVPPKPSVPILANGLSRLPPSLGTCCSSSLLCLCLPFIYSSPPLTPINVYKPSPRHAFGCFLPACPRVSPRGSLPSLPPLLAVLPDCWHPGFCPHHVIELSQQRPSVTSNPMSS